jgi:hypothetical protein
MDAHSRQYRLFVERDAPLSVADCFQAKKQSFSDQKLWKSQVLVQFCALNFDFRRVKSRAFVPGGIFRSSEPKRMSNPHS